MSHSIQLLDIFKTVADTDKQTSSHTKMVVAPWKDDEFARVKCLSHVLLQHDHVAGAIDVNVEVGLQVKQNSYLL